MINKDGNYRNMFDVLAQTTKTTLCFRETKKAQSSIKNTVFKGKTVNKTKEEVDFTANSAVKSTPSYKTNQVKFGSVKLNNRKSVLDASYKIYCATLVLITI